MGSLILKTNLQVFCLLLLPFYGLSQYAPQAGKSGTTAIHKDSSIIQTFSNYSPGSQGKNLLRGWVNMSDTNLGKTTVGNIDSIFNTPEQFMISLGDGGMVTLQLPIPIKNGQGADFVIFENGFAFSKDSFFLELAFVEVSKDGHTFYRFPAYSETDTTQQIGPFGSIQAHKVHNLAGKYVMPFGVPFDLEDLKNELGTEQSIQFIRLIDVIGSIHPMHANRDFKGRIINDPWPTPFPSGGFDLTGIGFIHGDFTSLSEHEEKLDAIIYPNPANESAQINFISHEDLSELRITDCSGFIQKEFLNVNQSNFQFMVNECAAGIYFVEAISKQGKLLRKKLLITN
jgi:hypothetical protein